MKLKLPSGLRNKLPSHFSSKLKNSFKEKIDHLGRNLNQVKQKLRGTSGSSPDIPLEQGPLGQPPSVKSSFGRSLKNSLKEFDPQSALTWASGAIQGTTFRRSAGFYGKLTTIILSTYFVSDLTALMATRFIPEPPPSLPTQERFQSYGGQFSNRNKTVNDYASIFGRNLFSSRGLTPGEEEQSEGENKDELSGPAVKSTLPLELIGTLVMLNELNSIATIADKSVSIVYPVRVDDEIPNKIRVLIIEPRKVIFLNLASRKKEYIELPEDHTLITRNPILTPGSGAAGAGPAGIEKLSPTQFNVSRVEVDKALSDFNNILTQARAVPNFENGVPAGYKLFQIVPGSIYDKLGLQNGDVISGLNGQPINDPGKAFEMLSELKTSNHLELQIKKSGKSSTYSYDIH